MGSCQRRSNHGVSARDFENEWVIPGMLLPNKEGAYVDHVKIRDYLLAPTHPDGRGKAEFFMRRGFRSERWMELV